MATAVIESACRNYNILDGVPDATDVESAEDQSAPLLLDDIVSDANVPPIILLHFWRGDFEGSFAQ